MPEQFSMAGFDAAPKLTDRLFFAIFPDIAWRVREFVLVHSLLGRTVHLPLARWPLST
jgi:2'-5' RNA ligase